MKNTLFALLLAACAAPAFAQEAQPAAQPGKTEAAAPQKKTTRAKAKPAPAQAAAQPAPARKAVKQEPAKPAEEPEESVVMIDSKAEPEEIGRFSAAGYAPDQEEQPAVPGGMPSSYGQLKGVMNDGGRTLLVLESPDDGTITFVQVIAGKAGVSWKLVDRVPRSLD
ncbi:MAG: hypothetical protein A2049_06130 [Elusimicrobia bacterium GWA2_62_23]|nr:MAG: hypothetical protein A2049_06130 [Elusimicrobia bacterium GWA2_62_23]